MAQRDLQKLMALANQEIVLFDLTVAENIVCGRSGAGRSAIEAAVSAASAHDFIQRLPTATTRAWASTGCRCPAAGGTGSPQPERSSATPPPCCLMRRLLRWIRRRRRRCKPPSSGWKRIAPVNDNYFSFRIDSGVLLPSRGRCLSRMLPKTGGNEWKLSASRRGRNLGSGARSV